MNKDTIFIIGRLLASAESTIGRVSKSDIEDIVTTMMVSNSKVEGTVSELKVVILGSVPLLRCKIFIVGFCLYGFAHFSFLYTIPQLPT